MKRRLEFHNLCNHKTTCFTSFEKEEAGKHMNTFIKPSDTETNWGGFPL